MHLPGMSQSIADAILDWVDRDTTPRQFGAEASYYAGLGVPYGPRNAEPTSLEELLLVRDVTRDMLFGADENFNYQIDPGEQASPSSGTLSAAGDSSDGSLERFADRVQRREESQSQRRAQDRPEREGLDLPSRQAGKSRRHRTWPSSSFSSASTRRRQRNRDGARPSRWRRSSWICPAGHVSGSPPCSTWWVQRLKYPLDDAAAHGRRFAVPSRRVPR